MTMNKVESMERFRDGLRRAASCARECAAGTGNSSWLDVAKHLDNICKMGEVLESVRALSDIEREAHIKRIQGEQNAQNMVEQAVKASKPTVH